MRTYTQCSAETSPNHLAMTCYERYALPMRRGLTLLCFLYLTACGTWPDAGGPSAARGSQDWPELLPLDALLETGQIPTAPTDQNASLAERADALRARAAALRARSATVSSSRSTTLSNRATVLRSDASDLDALRARLNP